MRLTGAVVVFQDITERKQFEETITRRNAELAAQNTIAATLNQSLHLDAVLNTTLDAALSVFEMDVGGIHLLDPTSEMLTLRAYRGGSTSPEMTSARSASHYTSTNVSPGELSARCGLCSTSTHGRRW